MAVKFAVYEMMRNLHSRLNDGRPANVAEDLIMGGVAGAAAAAATTPLDVVKTVMMCSASSRPTIVSAAAGIMQEGKGLRPFFRGVGPRALSNGLNSAIFFCFFEAIRQVRRGLGHTQQGRPARTERFCAARVCEGTALVAAPAGGQKAGLGHDVTPPGTALWRGLHAFPARCAWTDVHPVCYCTAQRGIFWYAPPACIRSWCSRWVRPCLSLRASQVLIKKQQELKQRPAKAQQLKQQQQGRGLMARLKLQPAGQSVAASRPQGSPAACLTLALPVPGCQEQQ